MFNKKNITLEAYAPVGDLIDIFPIEKSESSYPSWYKNLPKGYNDNNVRNCTGIRDLFGEGFMIPSWGEYQITIHPDGESVVESPVQLRWGHSSKHNISTEAPGAWPGYVNIKLHNPWWFWCPKPIKWLMIQPTWAQQDPQEYTIVPGVTEFRYNNQANINTIWKVKEYSYTVKISAGDMLAQIIPITEEKIGLELKVLTDEIYGQKFAPWMHSFRFGYQKLRAIMEKRNRQ